MGSRQYIPTKHVDPWLRLVLQVNNLKKYYPTFDSQNVPGRGLVCTGKIQPSDYSQFYEFRLTLAQRAIPHVSIVDPVIPWHPDIHMYSNGTLCLYDHRARRWHKEDELYKTIIPWLAEWLVCYELYQLTGTWHGPAAPHGNKAKVPQSKLPS